LQFQILSIAGLALVLSIAGAMLTARNVTQPIARLVRAVRGISEGDYQQRIEYDSRASTEIEALGRSFEQMQRIIAEREEMLSRQAFVDPLTGLSSRAAISEYLQQITQSPPGGFSVMRLNINGF